MDLEAAPPRYTPLLDDSELPPDYKFSFDIPEKPTPSPDYEESFRVETPKYNDVFFTYTFFGVLILFSYLTYNSYQYSGLVSDDFNITKVSKPMKALYTLIWISIIVPVLCSMFLLFLVYLFPTFFVVTAFLITPISFLSIGFFSLLSGQIFPALIYSGFGALSLLFLFQYFKRFSFAGLMLKIIIDAVKSYPSTILVSFLSTVITILFSIAFMVAAAVILNTRSLIDDSSCPHNNGNDVCISNTSMIIYLFVIFAGCYLFQVIENTTHVILSGIFSSWYFFDTASVKPKFPILGATRRALTYCFGSICFGSLLVALMETVRTTLSLIKTKLQMRNLENDDRDNNGSLESNLLFCFLICVVSILEWLASEFEYWMKWFNRYAYSYVAMYGKSYLKSAKDTFEILKYKGIDILINDSLISQVLTLYSILTIVFTTSVLYFIFNYSNINGISEMSSEMLIIGVVGGVLISWFIINCSLKILEVGCITFVLGLAIDPDAFTRTDAGGASNSSIRRIQQWESLSRFYPGIKDRVYLDWPDHIEA